jgi:hypothetical protein
MDNVLGRRRIHSNHHSCFRVSRVYWQFFPYEPTLGSAQSEV